MSTLREVRDTLTKISHPDRVLRYADGLMELRRTDGESFKLNSADAWLKPILEFYTEDLDGFVAFVRNVRDRLDNKTEEYRGVYEFYKTLNVRSIQRRTRAMLDVAIDLAVRKGYIENSFEAKQRYSKRCIQSWKARKDAMLANVRNSSPTGRVSLSHREELLSEFWSNAAAEVNNGEIPKP